MYNHGGDRTDTGLCEPRSDPGRAIGTIAPSSLNPAKFTLFIRFFTIRETVFAI